jgi:hypothetical protein
MMGRTNVKALCNKPFSKLVKRRTPYFHHKHISKQILEHKEKEL